MNVQLIVRIVLAAAFGFLGYQISSRFLLMGNSGAQLGINIVAAIVLGAVGVYVVPVVSSWIKNWSTVFSQRVANEVISQLHIPRIRRSSNGKEKEKSTYLNPIVVDTSVLIDGRIAEVAESGFLSGTLIVPRFILSELQHIADASDALRRGKGRRGLEVLEQLKKSKWIKTVIYTGNPPDEKNIDDKILGLAKGLKARILTTDFNLNKVATVSGIKILNINELANSLKTILLPGENLEVKVIQEGKEKTQGVGYLPDGTMIVVENGASFVGETISTTVSRVLQTVAGRMIFVQVSDLDKNKTTK
ncbi:MAG: hypothetical protein A2172_01780 [Candidatus Woykebacteria bacterium RBG_13_40_15]|uniref:TRAM domain-containing protein n=1 Tax=Candidatus Woykebacteria bacterium RBG_13_40_15 TaxID=1802593 RepID=A0A1G1W9W0_9BACT|nr:MAG: hypothetical protein A2172_01780 [Candidatus Woykebacteria bacterium RBG_13_40_15]